ncbi:MAG TPA: 2Fe-2S iron-sulfur cluster-binding protein, partial [Thermoplasmataceae archaeon]|nr:2Fe-2S iron-sulfur cluster-binding protein [Thermoplasmataceae archaeon]
MIIISSSKVIEVADISENEKLSVLQYLTSHQIDIPHICYHPNLGPIKSCDTCLVEI